MSTKQFLVYCQYDYYCQGTESTWGYFLVTAKTFREAKDKVRDRVENARDFEDKTID